MSLYQMTIAEFADSTFHAQAPMRDQMRDDEFRIREKVRLSESRVYVPWWTPTWVGPIGEIDAAVMLDGRLHD